MIRFAENNDTQNIISLWEICFKKDDFSNWFFKNMFNPLETIVIEENGRIVSMLQRLAFDIKNIGEVTYIYGACTHPDYRGKGFMEQLLVYSENLDKEKSIKASVLIPQEKSLFDFYAKFGYQPLFKIFNKKYTKQNAKDHFYSFSECKSYKIDTLNNLYEKLLENANYVKRDRKYWELQFKMFDELNGKVFCLEYEGNAVGYAFCWNDNGGVIQELVGVNNDINKIICFEVMEHYNIESIEAFSLTGTISEREFGCIKSYEKIESDQPFVMNLMLN